MRKLTNRGLPAPSRLTRVLLGLLCLASVSGFIYVVWRIILACFHP